MRQNCRVSQTVKSAVLRNKSTLRGVTPNHSVNLTRNSAPRWPSEARYAHNAPLVQQVTLSHSGYLKR
jgi:hypothetical protein